MKQQTIDNLIEIKSLSDDIIKELLYCNDGNCLSVIGDKVSKIKQEIDDILKIDLELG
jgi:hypothetical protein